MTQTMDLNKMGLVEMHQNEMEETDGGIIPWLAAAIIAAAVSIANNWGDVRHGFSDGYNGAAPRYN